MDAEKTMKNNTKFIPELMSHITKLTGCIK